MHIVPFYKILGLHYLASRAKMDDFANLQAVQRWMTLLICKQCILVALCVFAKCPYRHFRKIARWERIPNPEERTLCGYAFSQKR